MTQVMRRLIQDLLPGGTLIQLITIKRKNIELKKSLIKFQKKYNLSLTNLQFLISGFVTIKVETN